MKVDTTTKSQRVGVPATTDEGGIEARARRGFLRDKPIYDVGKMAWGAGCYGAAAAAAETLQRSWR